MRFWKKFIVIGLIFLPMPVMAQYRIITGDGGLAIKYDEESGEAWILKGDHAVNLLSGEKEYIYYWKKIEEIKKDAPEKSSGRNLLRENR